MAATTALNVGNKAYQIYSFKGLDQAKLAKLPFSMKILLENLMRHEDGVNVTQADIDAVLNWQPTAEPSHEIAYMPARVVMQDFTGVPCIVDLAAMRDAVINLGGDPKKVNPQIPAELVIDHSVMVDHFGTHDAIEKNAQVEFERNEERYRFLRWGQLAFEGFKVVPPDTGIVHQVNVEYLARTVFVNKDGVAYPDTVVGTDSHTTMVNGIGVLGWGVGGIEAEAAMLGQPSTMLIPHVIGFKLTGKLSEGVTTTDLVLTVTQMLRKRGVVEKFVEFFGPGLKDLPLADRATIANMAPEYGATCGIFPIDGETVRYLKLTGRDQAQLDLVEAYAKAQGLWREDNAPDANYTDVLELDMSTVQPSLAGPKRPQDRVLLTDMKSTFETALAPFAKERAAQNSGSGVAMLDKNGKQVEMKDGAVVITAITSCTNTSNPAVLIAAGLVARKARALGLDIQPWVKPSLAPGSKVVNDYLAKAGLLEDLEALKFHIVGYGCTTCIGNSGPLPEEVSKAIADGNLNVASVLSGNRNFEGRVHAEVRMNFLASPPLVVAYAIAGTVNIDLHKDSLGKGTNGQDVYLKDIWPSNAEVQSTIESCLSEEMFRASYADVFAGDHRWQGLEVPTGDTYAWDEKSSYVANPPYFVGMSKEAPGIKPITGARCLAVLGDSITTDHISPAGNIKKDSPGGAYLMSKGVKPIDFNSYGSRRGHHEVMMRGTFANIRIRNTMTPGIEGGVTAYQPAGDVMPIYDAAMKYQADGVPLVILAGKEYGTGSSRDWAAKGTMLQGVKAVITESFERIHRSNLVGMGVLPLVFTNGQNAGSLGLDGTEVFGISEFGVGTKEVTVTATKPNGNVVTFTAKVRVDTPKEWEYFTHGGILPYVLRGMIG